jgi:hypothetical protein
MQVDGEVMKPIHLLAAPAIPVAVVLYHEPRLFLWLLAVAAVVTIAALANVAIARGRELDEVRGELERREREEEEAVVPVPLIPFDSLPKAERDHIAKDRPDLRIVQSPIPMQRRGDEWDAIVRAVEGEQS